ncbi:MAG TPA: Calx-beta domain-containing protein [Candidatus Limnocylindrales bacterium]|nr:Calx-beta domain-containing protein [Candidatus Limnocylindrales bacterium]
MRLGWKRVGAGSVASLMTLGGLLAVTGNQGVASCQREVAIMPEATVSESAGTLVFEVVSGGCAAAGAVTYTVSGGTSTPDVDFVLPAGQLLWTAGDATPRMIIAGVVNDPATEASIEDFTVTLTSQSQYIHVAQGIGRGRILDDDRPEWDWAIDGQICFPIYVVPVPGKPGKVVYSCDDLRPDPYSPVAINKPLQQATTLHWETLNGTAIAGVDFVGVTDQVQTVAAGATKVLLPVKLLPHPPGTPTRWFEVRIFGISQGVVVDDIALVVISGS